jgi:hypothetical protein
MSLVAEPFPAPISTAPAPASCAEPKAVIRSKRAIQRREAEFAEFISADYTWLIASVSRVDDSTLSVELKSGRKATVKRSLDFLNAPRIIIDGDRSSAVYDNDYSPALTSVRWLMMLLFVAPNAV